jgi:hypothetical protein
VPLEIHISCCIGMRIRPKHFEWATLRIDQTFQTYGKLGAYSLDNEVFEENFNKAVSTHDLPGMLMLFGIYPVYNADGDIIDLECTTFPGGLEDIILSRIAGAIEPGAEIYWSSKYGCVGKHIVTDDGDLCFMPADTEFGPPNPVDEEETIKGVNASWATPPPNVSDFTFSPEGEAAFPPIESKPTKVVLKGFLLKGEGYPVSKSHPTIPGDQPLPNGEGENKGMPF